MEELTENKPIGDKIHVSILGSCVLRDTIGYYHEGEKFIVDSFVQDISPLSAVDKSPLKKPLANFLYQENINVAGKEEPLSHFRRRNFVFDLEKSIFDYISEKNSEWLFIDVVCLRIAISYFNGCAISNAPSCDNVFSKLIEKDFISKLEKVVHAELLTEQEIKTKLDLFAERILKYYSQDKIIFFEIKAAKYCAQEDNTISTFVQEKQYSVVDKGYEYLSSKLSNCHIIEFPINTMGDQKHKWGRFPLHYVREYYDYAYAALEKICGGGYSSSEEEKADLSQLKAQYERIIDEKYKPYFVKTINGYLQYKTMYENLADNYKKRSDYFYNQLFIENSQDEFLRQECDLLRYVKVLDQLKSKYLIILAVRDTAGNCLTAEEVNAVKALGFSKLNTKPQNMYIGVLYNGKVVSDICGKERWQPVEVTLNDQIEGYKIKLSSMAWQHGNKAEIIINGTDYAVNMRGLNFVVYDTEDNKLIDSVAFDYHSPTRICKHK